MIQRPQFTLSILDPASFLGSETAAALWRAFPAARRRLFHTTGVADHLVTEIAGEAALVPPLTDASELNGSDVVVATVKPSPAVASALMAWLRANPGTILIDGTQPGLAPDESIPVFNAPRSPRGDRRWFQLADPALWGPGRFLQALVPLEPREVHLTVLMPVSSLGDPAVEELARQASARLSGRAVGKPEVLDAVLAFDVSPTSAFRHATLARQMGVVLPGVACRLNAIEIGTFHGDASVVAARCATPVNTAKALALVRRAPGIRVARKNERPQLTAALGSSDTVCSDLRADGEWITAWIVADGMRLGGAQAIADVLASVRAS